MGVCNVCAYCLRYDAWSQWAIVLLRLLLHAVPLYVPRCIDFAGATTASPGPQQGGPVPACRKVQCPALCSPFTAEVLLLRIGQIHIRLFVELVNA